MKKAILLFLAVLLFSEIFALSTYVVTKTTDVDPFLHPYKFNDADCDPDMYGTLQWAINKANDDNDYSRIEFNIPGTGQQEIFLNYYLPQITGPTEIDGRTQSGFTFGNPQIIINAQNKQNSVFNAYKTNVTIKGLKITSFAQNGILLQDCSNSLVAENVISNYSNSSTKTPFIGLFINGCQNVEVYGNEIEVLLNVTVDQVTKSYGIYLSKSYQCTIGGTGTNMANTIKNCRTYGVFLNSTQETKISGNAIFDCGKAIMLNYSNNNIQPPIINGYTNGILSGTALPNSTVEVFGSTGEENANEYLTSTIANENGDWSVGISTTYEFFAATQTDLNNNTSRLRNFRTCVYPSFNAIIDADDIVSLDTEYLWTLPEGYEPPPGTWATATYLIVCDNADPFLIYDQTSVSTIATSGMEEMPYFNWWEGECDMWTSESFQCIDWYFQNDLSDEIQILDGYGEVYEFDPAAWGVGVHIINAQYGSTCNLTRIYIEVLEAPDPTITPVGPFCDNDGVIQLQAIDGGGTWSGTGIVNTTAGTFVPYLAGAGQHTITYTNVSSI